MPTLLFCAAALSFALTHPLLAFRGSAKVFHPADAQLTFAERVAYQRAIENVYWHHRIWPKERPDPKPPLDAVMSQEQLEKKVRDYLRNSQMLEDYWQRPLTTEQLQNEMDRMAKHTKQPEVLRELFEAMGNDPFVIAECLARPALAERLFTNWYAHDEKIHGELKGRAEADLQAHPAVAQMRQTSGSYNEIELVKSDGSYQQRDGRPRYAMKLNSREWDETIQKLAVTFGVRSRGSGIAAFESAAPLNYESIPIGELSSLQEDESRFYATAVIEKTGDHLKLATVSWLKEPLESWLARAENQTCTTATTKTAPYTLPKISEGAGGCIDDTWEATAGPPPDGRYLHTAVWTGSEMIVWGGYTALTPADSDTGGKYTPSTDSWTATSTINAPIPRDSHTAVWTGNEMIIWGGEDENFIPLNSGGRYNPNTNSWTATSAANAPAARDTHTAVWTGSEMIVWGGEGSSGVLNSGGRYNRNANSWTATSTVNSPGARYIHTAVWTGSEMIIWGGQAGSFFLLTGGRYNPATNSWTATNTVNAPTARESHSVVWSGSEMIVWGGLDNNLSHLNTGARYNPGTNSWTATTAANAPAARAYHAAVWTGEEMIAWGGQDENLLALSTGGRYNPGTNGWTATNTTNSPAARESHTAVWTGSEMIVWGGINTPNIFGSGGRYCAQSGASPTPTATPSATATSTPTATPCTGRCAPTPRPRPTPARRP